MSLTAQERQTVLDIHNADRQALAKGTLKNSKGVAFPPAASMPNLVNI